MAWYDRDGASWLGTGSLFRTGRRLCVLTAMHNAKEFSATTNNGLFWRGLPDAIRDVVEGYAVAPAGVDVAVVVLKRGLEERLGALPALPVSAVASDEDCEIGEACSAALAGYPAASKVILAPDRIAFPPLYLLPETRRGCRAEGHASPGMHLGLGDSTTVVSSGEQRSMPDPEGMSGAAVWRVSLRKPALDELWAPTRDAKVVAVQVGYFAPLRCLRAEPASTWGAWFRELMEGLATE